MKRRKLLRPRDLDEEEDRPRRSARRDGRQPEPITSLNAFARAVEEPIQIPAYKPRQFTPPLTPALEVAPGVPQLGTSPSSLPTFAQMPVGGPMAAMQNMLGKHEGTDRVALMEYLKNGGVNLDPATTAWCAAIVNASLGQAGLPTTGSNMARSFLNYGTGVTEPQQGDIAVFQRGGPNAATGHVGFYQGRDAAGNILVLGGNQGNQVSVAPFAANSLLGYRRIAPPTGSFTKAALEPFQAGGNADWAAGKKGDVIDFNQQGQAVPREQRRGALADRLPSAPPVAGDIQPSLPPAPEQRRGPLADRLPGAPSVAPRPGMAIAPTNWSQQVFSAPAPGPNENVASALRDQALAQGRMSWAPTETSPGMTVGAPSGAAASSPAAAASSPFVDWLTKVPANLWGGKGWFS